jgi:hypothetical protein
VLFTCNPRKLPADTAGVDASMVIAEADSAMAMGVFMLVKETIF